MARINGTSGNDSLWGDPDGRSNDVLNGYGGDDDPMVGIGTIHCSAATGTTISMAARGSTSFMAVPATTRSGSSSGSTLITTITMADRDMTLSRRTEARLISSSAS